MSTVELTQAVTRAVETVTANNAGIPPVTLVIGATGRKSRGQVHGHFSPDTWVTRDDSTVRSHELFLSGESLARGGRDTLGTIIHELAHAYCQANDIRDTSNAGRYHNKRFKTVAESFGLTIDHAPTVGHSVTTVSDSLATEYQETIAELDKAITSYRDPLMIEKKTSPKPPQMGCPECQDYVPTQKKWFERNAGIIVCSDHEIPFEMIESD